MVSIKKGTIKDLESVLKLCRRVKDSLEREGNDVYSYGYPTDQYFIDDLSEGRAYILKDGSRVLAYLSYDRDLKGSFFPGAEGEEKVYQLLEDCNYAGEGYLVLHRLMVDPAYQGKGYGKTLLSHFMSKFKGQLLLLCVYEKSRGALYFYKALHSKNHGIYPFDYGPDYPGHEYLVTKYL